MMNFSVVEQFLSSNITLARLELVLIEVPQKESFTSAIGQRTSRKALIVKWITKNGIVGYGECSCRPDPYYSHEYVGGAMEVIKKFIFPRLCSSDTYIGVLKTLNQVRGWNFTKAAVEMAMNDAIRKETGKGILDNLDMDRAASVPVGISMGLFNTVNDLDNKLKEIEHLNYHRWKFKISPGYNDKAILEKLAHLNHANISFDANGSFNRQSFSLLDQFAGLQCIIEQPFPPGDIYLYQEYIKDYRPFKLCLDEEIESYGNLVSLSLPIDEVNIKPGRVGGLYETLKMIGYCLQYGVRAWIGGMFETGIGRAQNLQIAALLPQATAHDLSPSSRYFSRDVLVEPITMNDGYVGCENFMNIEVDEAAIDEMTIDKIVLQV
jgi:o-succinylbenzoate synthase